MSRKVGNPAPPATAVEALAARTSAKPGDPLTQKKAESRIPEHREEEKLAPSVLTIRRRWGYCLVVLGIVGAAVGFYFARQSLAALAHTSPRSAEHEHVLLGVLIAKGILSSAYFAFCYGLVRAGERMTVPAWWIRNSEDRRAVMGLRDATPPKSVRDLIEKLIDALGKK